MTTKRLQQRFNANTLTYSGLAALLANLLSGCGDGDSSTAAAVGGESGGGGGYVITLQYFNSDTDTVTIPKTVTSIDKGFLPAGHDTLDFHLTFEDDSTVAYIGDEAFESSNITSIMQLPASVTYIGDRAFKNYPDDPDQGGKLSSISFAEGGSQLNTIGVSAFSFQPIETLDLSQANNLTEIKETAFYDSDIQTVQLPASLQVIGHNVFSHDSDSTDQGGTLTSLNFATDELSLESIGSNAFKDQAITGDLDLQTATELTEIGIGAFLGSQFDSIKLFRNSTLYASLDEDDEVQAVFGTDSEDEDWLATDIVWVDA